MADTVKNAGISGNFANPFIAAGQYNQTVKNTQLQPNNQLSIPQAEEKVLPEGPEDVTCNQESIPGVMQKSDQNMLQSMSFQKKKPMMGFTSKSESAGQKTADENREGSPKGFMTEGSRMWRRQKDKLHAEQQARLDTCRNDLNKYVQDQRDGKSVKSSRNNIFNHLDSAASGALDVYTKDEINSRVTSFNMGDVSLPEYNHYQYHNDALQTLISSDLQSYTENNKNGKPVDEQRDLLFDDINICNEMNNRHKSVGKISLPFFNSKVENQIYDNMSGSDYQRYADESAKGRPSAGARKNLFNDIERFKDKPFMNNDVQKNLFSNITSGDLKRYDDAKKDGKPLNDFRSDLVEDVYRFKDNPNFREFGDNAVNTVISSDIKDYNEASKNGKPTDDLRNRLVEDVDKFKNYPGFGDNENKIISTITSDDLQRYTDAFKNGKPVNRQDLTKDYDLVKNNPKLKDQADKLASLISQNDVRQIQDDRKQGRSAQDSRNTLVGDLERFNGSGLTADLQNNMKSEIASTDLLEAKNAIGKDRGTLGRALNNLKEDLSKNLYPDEGRRADLEKMKNSEPFKNEEATRQRETEEAARRHEQERLERETRDAEERKRQEEARRKQDEEDYNRRQEEERRRAADFAARQQREAEDRRRAEEQQRFMEEARHRQDQENSRRLMDSMQHGRH